MEENGLSFFLPHQIRCLRYSGRVVGWKDGRKDRGSDKLYEEVILFCSCWIYFPCRSPAFLFVLVLSPLFLDFMPLPLYLLFPILSFLTLYFPAIPGTES